jgi:hypothetical protein
LNDVPESVAPIVELMSSFPAHWALCGGWAIDAWLGRQTRDHDDVDFSVFIQDQRALFDHLGDRPLVAHVIGDTHAPWDGRHLDYPNHAMGRIEITPEPGIDFDFQFGDRDGDDWVLNEEPSVVMPIAAAVRESPWGLPTVVPEALLFFKSLDLRRRDKLDFQLVLPHLAREQRAWLHDAISLVGHPWLEELSV